MEKLHTYDVNEVNFHNFDVHVSKVEAMHMKSVASLIEYLRETITEDKYKEIFIVRAFLVWMNHMKANGVEDIPQELGELLTSHPATSLATLCSAANIPHHVIYGIGKDMDYIPGQTEDDGNILQTAWIAFKSEERWHLVDPQRVLSTIRGHQRGGEILLELQGKPILEEQMPAAGTKIMYVDEFWFGLDPSIFIIHFLPDDPEWQLLPSDKRISKSDFLALALLRPAFFTASLQLLSGQTSVLQTKNGRCTVTFGAEKSSVRYINMSYKLSLIKGTGNLEVVDVNDLPLLVMYAPSIDTFSFNIRFPIAAEYLFETYVSAPGVDGGLTNSSLFKIICSEPDPHCKKLPLDVGNTGYGFGYAAVDFGLKNPSVHKPNVTFDCKDTEDVDMKELTFQIEDDKINDIEFSSDVVGEDKDTSVVTETRVDEVSGKLHVKAGVKKEGEYTLSIIAREKNTDQMYRRIVNFLLTTKSFGEDNDFELVSKKRKRDLTLQSKMQERLDKKNVLSEKIKAIQEEIDRLKKTYEENRSNRATQTDDVSHGVQLATETKTTQTGSTLSLHGEATQTDIITTLVSDKETQCEETNTDAVFNRSERTTLDGSRRLVLKAVEEDGKIVILAEKSEVSGDQMNASNPAVRKSGICAVL